MNRYYDCLGHELHVNDYIQFRTSGFTVVGQITAISDEEQEISQLDLFGKANTGKRAKKAKYVVSPVGWKGAPELRSKIKNQYKVNVSSSTVCLVTVKSKK